MGTPYRGLNCVPQCWPSRLLKSSESNSKFQRISLHSTQVAKLFWGISQMKSNGSMCMCPESWRYVASEQNPADVATRGCSARDLPLSSWLKGPDFLRNGGEVRDQPPTYDLVNPETDKEVRKQVNCSKTTILSQEPEPPEKTSTWCERFKRFSTWKSLVRAISYLKGYLHSVRSRKLTSAALKEDAEFFIIKEAQGARYLSEILAIKGEKQPPPIESFVQHKTQQ